MSLMNGAIPLRPGLHQFPGNVFGSISDLIEPSDSRERDSLIIACSELGAAPDNVSFAKREQFIVLQHLAASMPSRNECEMYEGLSFEAVERLFDRYEFRRVIVCGHVECGVIHNWLQPSAVASKWELVNWWTRTICPNQFRNESS